MRQVLGGDAEAGVLHLDGHDLSPTGQYARAHGDAHVTTVWRVLDRVGDEVPAQLARTAGGGHHENFVRKLELHVDPLGLGLQGELLDRLLDRRHDVQRLHVGIESGLDLSEIEQVGDQLGHEPGGLQDCLAALALAAGLGERAVDQRRHAVDHRDRVLEIVRHVLTKSFFISSSVLRA